jgi:hypothetical protein
MTVHSSDNGDGVFFSVVLMLHLITILVHSHSIDGIECIASLTPQNNGTGTA